MLRINLTPSRKQPLRRLSEATRPPQPPDQAWKQHGWRTMRSAHVTQDRVFVGARAFVVGAEIVEGVRVNARAISALYRHGAAYAQAKAEGKPTCEPMAERRAA